MYQQMVELCSPHTMAHGPVINPAVVLKNPGLQEEYIGNITSLPREQFSLYVFEVMDRLGYNYEMIKYRQNVFKEFDSITNAYGNGAQTCITTGGKGEGTTLYYESDIDWMSVITDVIVADKPHFFNHKENITLFQTERLDTPPGYTRLKLIRFGGKHAANLIRQSLFRTYSGIFYLSSKLLSDTFHTIAETCKSPYMTVHKPSGPSQPGSLDYLDGDVVNCFKCFCPDIVERWVYRHRKHGWPSQEVISEVSQLDGHVVPVGMKGSDNMYREWRICYSLAELHLMRNLNDTQVKVYIIMKKMCKSVLQPVCQDMTSYIMKNVVLWICEENEIAQFKPGLLIDRLIDSLKYLRRCIVENNMPSYMIPERNLLYRRMNDQKRHDLTKLLSDLLNEDGRMLLRCDRIRDAMLLMYLTPEMLRDFGERRDNVEHMMLMRNLIRRLTLRPKMSSEEMRQKLAQNEHYQGIQILLFKCLNNLSNVDVQKLSQNGKSIEELNSLWHVKVYRLFS